MHQFVLYIYYFLYFWRWGSSTAHEKCISLYLLVLCTCTIYLLVLCTCTMFFLYSIFSWMCTAHEKCINLCYIFTCMYFLYFIFSWTSFFFGVGGVVLPMENAPACTIYLLVLDVFLVLFLGCHVFLQSGE